MYIGYFSLHDLEQIIEVHLSRMLAGDMFVTVLLRYLQYGFPYHAKVHSMISKDNLRSTQE